jgi:hypothetical protein
LGRRCRSASEGRDLGPLAGGDGRILKIGWIETGMALKAAYGEKDGLDLWSITHIDQKARTDAPAQWASFAAEVRPGDVTIATIIKAAKDVGFAFGSATQSASVDSVLNDECASKQPIYSIQELSSTILDIGF